MFEFEPMTEEELQKKERYFKEGDVSITIRDMVLSKHADTGRSRVVCMVELVDSTGKTGAFQHYLAVNFKIMEFLKGVCSTREEYEAAKSLAMTGKFDYIKYIGACADGSLKYSKDKVDPDKEWANLFFKPVKYGEVIARAVTGDTQRIEAIEFNDEIPF